jgi:hypothetical protein
MASEPSPPTATSASVLQLNAAVGLHAGVGKGVALVRGTQQRAAQAGDAFDPLGRQWQATTVAEALGAQQAVVAVAYADAVPAAQQRGARDGAGDGVQAGGVAAADGDGDAANGRGGSRHGRKSARVGVVSGRGPGSP